MGSSATNLDLENLNLILAHGSKIKELEIKPIPYTFTKIEKGKKMVLDQASIPPPIWSLLDHTIAVVWLMFSANNSFHQLNINDLKWAHEFLKEIRNNKGENPPDVKTCLKQIQDRLIDLYAKLTNVKDDFFDQYNGTFGETIFEESKTSFSSPRRMDESKQLDRMSVASSLSPSRTTIRLEYPLFHRHSSRDITVAVPKSKRLSMGHSKKGYPLMSKNSNIFEDAELEEDEDIEKYLLNLFDDEKKEDSLQSRPSTKSFIPTKKRIAPSLSISEMISNRDFSDKSKEKIPKKVHCVAEMRSLKFQKSMKLQDKNGEESAYSNLKTEIRRLTIDPEVSKNEIRKFLKEWRSEQVEKLHNELSRLNSIEEIIKGIDEPRPNPENSSIDVKEIDSSKSKNSFGLSLLP